MTTAMLEKLSAEDLAKAFAKVLKEWLSDEEMAAVVATNKADGYDASTCASHDFCDANMAMDEAYKKIYPEFDKAAWDDNDKTEGLGKLWDKHTDLWNEAWDLAKRADFYITEG